MESVKLCIFSLEEGKEIGVIISVTYSNRGRASKCVKYDAYLKLIKQKIDFPKFRDNIIKNLTSYNRFALY